MPDTRPDDKALLTALAILSGAAFVWSAVNPHDYFTWFLEIAPILIVLPVLIATHRGFRLSRPLYALIAIHSVILMVGGHYTYAEVPLFNWIRDAFHLSRNHYDRLGHFLQGFVPAVATRELLLRRSPLRRGKWLVFLTVSVCLAFSALYELIEWQAAELTGSAADAFLGTQGDVWDSQKDMFMCLVGAVAAMALMPRLHDREIARVEAAR